MLVFIDESGCRGFKLVRGSDPVFVIAMVIFRSAADAARTEAVIRDLHEAMNRRVEFKFSRCPDTVRDAFFRSLARCPFGVRALVVRKVCIQSERLHSSAEAFYSFIVQQLMRFDGGILSDARIRIDGSGHREFQRILSSYLRRELRGKVREVKMKDSARDPLTQLADMCAGAIARAYRDRSRPDRWLEMLRPRVQEICEYPNE